MYQISDVPPMIVPYTYELVLSSYLLVYSIKHLVYIPPVRRTLDASSASWTEPGWRVAIQSARRTNLEEDEIGDLRTILRTTWYHLLRVVATKLNYRTSVST